MTPEAAMREALASARRGLGRTFPNPSVGAVVFRPKGPFFRGRTQRPPGPHAEIVALAGAARAGVSTRGASIAVTLEPCCFTGRTGPCTDALIEAGIRKVYVGCTDPHPKVAGRGLRLLRAAGLSVETGVLERECRALHRGFLSVFDAGRPFVTLKLATSLDGRIGTPSGESRWITGPESRRFVHGLRNRTDAILVGSGTAIADDPHLSARSDDRITHRPVRIIIDSRLRVPLRAALYQDTALARTVVLTKATARGIEARRKLGAEVLTVRQRGGHLDLTDGFAKLAKLGITTVLVEGGGELAAALLRAKLVDEIHWLQAPILLGGDARPALAALELARLADAPVLEHVSRRVRGSDLHWTARVGRSVGRTTGKR